MSESGVQRLVSVGSKQFLVTVNAGCDRLLGSVPPEEYGFVANGETFANRVVEALLISEKVHAMRHSTGRDCVFSHRPVFTGEQMFTVKEIEVLTIILYIAVLGCNFPRIGCECLRVTGSGAAGRVFRVGHFIH
jgi:hypothetical protein